MIPAFSCKQKSLGDGEIQDYVNDTLRTIEDDIKKSIEDDRTSACTELPVFFDVQGMDNKRAQRHIYFHTLKMLRKAGYIPKLDIQMTENRSQRVFIYTTWFTKEDTEYEDYMDKYIKHHIVSDANQNPQNPQINSQINPKNPKKNQQIKRRRRRAG